MKSRARRVNRVNQKKLLVGIGIAADKPKGKDLLVQSCALKNQWACTKAKEAK